MDSPVGWPWTAVNTRECRSTVPGVDAVEGLVLRVGVRPGAQGTNCGTLRGLAVRLGRIVRIGSGVKQAIGRVGILLGSAASTQVVLSGSHLVGHSSATESVAPDRIEGRATRYNLLAIPTHGSDDLVPQKRTA